MKNFATIAAATLTVLAGLASGCERAPEAAQTRPPPPPVPVRPPESAQSVPEDTKPDATDVERWEPENEEVIELVEKFRREPVTTEGVDYESVLAVAAIAGESGDEELRRFANRMMDAAVYIRCAADPPNSFRLKDQWRSQSFDGAVAFLRQYPEAGVYLIRKFDEVSQGHFGGHAFIKLITHTWHDSYIPALEELMRTSTYTCPYMGESYFLRRQAALLLWKRTGRRYTYVDFDGQCHKVSENPW